MASLEWNFEELLMRKLATDSRLVGIPMRHWEKDDHAILESLVFRAVKGEYQLSGVQAYEVGVTVIFVSGTMTPDEVDSVAAAVSEMAYDPTPFNPNLPEIYFARLEPETTTSRKDNKKTRARTVFFPFLGKLTTTPGPPVPDVNYKTATDYPNSGDDHFQVNFPVAFPSLPSFADARLNPPNGQPAIGIQSITRTTAHMIVYFDVALPAAGYELNTYAIL